MKTSDKQWLFLLDIAKLIQYADTKGYKLTGGEAYRTMYQQEKYLADGLSKTLDSQHLKRLAMDFNLFIDGDIQWNLSDEWKVLGAYWESLSKENEWGGNWRFLDVPHFQRND